MKIGGLRAILVPPRARRADQRILPIGIIQDRRWPASVEVAARPVEPRHDALGVPIVPKDRHKMGKNAKSAARLDSLASPARQCASIHAEDVRNRLIWHAL